MKLTWLDTYEIALMLDEKYPDIDPRVCLLYTSDAADE